MNHMGRPKGSRNGASKANAIREQLKTHPNAKTSEIVKLLADKGTKVLANHVYAIRTHAKKKQNKQRRAAASAAAHSVGMSNPIQAVLEVRSLAMKLGGISHLKRLVDLLAE